MPAHLLELIRVEVRCAPKVGAMRADLTKVRQALFNLLSNLFLAYLSQGGVNRATYVTLAVSTDGGTNFTSPTGVGQSHPKIEAPAGLQNLTGPPSVTVNGPIVRPAGKDLR
jgi:hypothetical protein